MRMVEHTILNEYELVNGPRWGALQLTLDQRGHNEHAPQCNIQN
eukprot:COSAG02_NODE_22335_length_756_cov_0.694064_2_plen_43_part_01